MSGDTEESTAAYRAYIASSNNKAYCDSPDSWGLPDSTAAHRAYIASLRNKGYCDSQDS